MNELERDLRLLAGTIEWPEPGGDLAASVRVALERAPVAPRRRLAWPMRRLVAVAAAVLLVSFAAAMAVPQARTAILRALGIGSVRVELVDELPPVAARADLSVLGLPVSLEEARRGFPYPLLAPDTDALGRYDEVRLGLVRIPQVSYVWRDGSGGVRLLVSVLPGRFIGAQFVKVAGPGTHLEDVTVAGRRALWITGDAHGFGLDRPEDPVDYEMMRLAGNTLLVERGETTVRIEGDLTLAQAQEVARALHPVGPG
ncbi:MAG TPA: hypothetical protein VH572_08660 [Gaiella sp.]